MSRRAFTSARPSSPSRSIDVEQTLRRRFDRVDHHPCRERLRLAVVFLGRLLYRESLQQLPRRHRRASSMASWNVDVHRRRLERVARRPRRRTSTRRSSRRRPRDGGSPSAARRARADRRDGPGAAGTEPAESRRRPDGYVGAAPAGRGLRRATASRRRSASISSHPGQLHDVLVAHELVGMLGDDRRPRPRRPAARPSTDVEISPAEQAVEPELEERRRRPSTASASARGRRARRRRGRVRRGGRPPATCTSYFCSHWYQRSAAAWPALSAS